VSNFTDVVRFHKKFGLGDTKTEFPFETGPRVVSKEWIEFRIKFMNEELEEFIKGYAELDHAQMADALIDLTYVAMGTALGLGYPWQALWEEVQSANMRKVKGATKRGVLFDVTKPEGWRPPRIATILKSFGFFK